MRNLGTVVAKLALNRRRFNELLSPGPSLQPFYPHANTPSQGLQEVTAFGSNPGNLRMLTYVPEQLAPDPALVVVLHGCTQTATGFAHATGWVGLAQSHGFAVLAPEQRQANNPKTCFTWFQNEDTTRDHGEALSIRQMIEHMIVERGIDRRRVFVTGLSAGGAMTSVMLAAYPEVFAAGAIIAGLPYRAATNVQEALESMFQGKRRSADDWGALVRQASTHTGPWPRVSVWHGGADKVVKPVNAEEIVKQWCGVHGLAVEPDVEQSFAGYEHRSWQDGQGVDVIEEYLVETMGHGVPISADTPSDGAVRDDFFLDVGINSSERIAQFWGLADRHAEALPTAPLAVRAPTVEDEAPTQPRQEDTRLRGGGDVRAVIEKALKAAGLMKS